MTPLIFRATALVLVGMWAAQETKPQSSPPPSTPASQPAAAPTLDQSFDPVQAILEEHCIGCHSGDYAPRGADLESRASIFAQRAGRPALVTPGDPDASEIYRRIVGTSEPRMPIDGPPWLTDEQIEVIRTWIAGLPRERPPTPAPAPAPTPTSRTDAPAEQARPDPAPSRPRPAANAPVTFAAVRPILAANCMRCHVNNGDRGPAPEGLVLTSLDSILRSSERPAVIPGNASASLMVRHVIGTEKPRMPFDGPPWLNDDEVDLLRRWINEGARDEAGKASPVPVGREVRLEGTLTAEWAVDGVAFRIAGGARVRDVRVGGRVEVRATIQADGSLLATRVRGR